jgi:hypothetical protein
MVTRQAMLNVDRAWRAAKAAKAAAPAKAS